MIVNRICLAVLAARMSPKTEVRQVCTGSSTERGSGRLCRAVAEV